MWWRLGDGAGATSAADASGNNQVGTFAGAATKGIRGALDGDTDTAAGADGLIVSANDPPGSMSVELWIRVLIPAAGSVVTLGDAKGDPLATVDLAANGSVSATTYAKGPSPQTATATGPDSIPVSDGSWHHIVAILVPSAPLVYVDAVAGPTAITNASWDPACPFGTVCPDVSPRVAVGSDGLSLNVDEFASYPTVLSADRVAAHFAAGSVDGAGPPSDDQTAPVGADETDNGTPASFVAMSVIGPVDPATYSTELWTADQTEVPGGEYVISSTSPGTYGLSGAVIDVNTGAVVAGATVSIETRPNPDCGTCSPLATATTTSSTTGGFGFANIAPAPSGYTQALTVSAPGYGTYERQNLAVSADGTYQSTVMLDTSNQTWNDSVTPDRSTTSGTSENDDNVNLASTSLYYARSYPPPYIRVRVYNIGPSSCFVPTTDPYVRRWFRTRFYVLHTAAREINGANWPDDRPVSRGGTGGTSPFRQFAFQAVAQWILNYAWYHSLITSTSVAAVDNTTNSQCFDPGATIPRQYGNIAVDWNAWASAAMQYRMVQFGDVGKLTETGFLGAGTELCSTASSCYGAVSCTPDLGVFADSVFDPHLPHTGSQLGAKRANDYCFVDWKDIAQHYFQYNNGLPERTGELAPSLQPPAPQPGYLHVDNTSSSGQLSFTFSVRFKNVPVGWKYQIVRSTAPNTSGTAICCSVPPSPKAGGAVEPVEQTFTYQPPADTRQSNARCYYYRVRAWNPDGWGYFTNFVASANVVAGTSGKEICPAV